MKYWLIGLIIGLALACIIFILGGSNGYSNLGCWKLMLFGCSNVPVGEFPRPTCGNPFPCVANSILYTFLSVIVGLIIGWIYGRIKSK